MNPPIAERLRASLSQGNWDPAIVMLQRMDPAAAADVLMSLPFEHQQALFRRLSPDLAATLIAALPYYHAYVLLHSRPIEEMAAIVDKMSPGQRLQFFDELPEEAWQRLMDELAKAEHQQASRAAVAVEEAPAVAGKRRRSSRSLRRGRSKRVSSGRTADRCRSSRPRTCPSSRAQL